MVRNLKVLGLALAAMFALTAVAATVASAQTQGTLTSDGPVTLTGSENGEKPDFLEAFGIKVECPGSTYTGHKYNETPHTLIPSGATTITLTPHYKQTTATGKINCKALGFPATVKMNGCDYVLHIGNTTGVADTYAITADVVCPANQSVEVLAYTTEAEDPATPFCTIKVGTQAGKTGATVVDTTNGTGDLKGTVTGISASRTNHGAHTILCPAANTNLATFKAEDLVTGHNSLGVATNISLTHP